MLLFSHRALQKTMPLVQNDKWILAYYNNVNACIIFIPLMFIFGESHRRWPSMRTSSCLVSCFVCRRAQCHPCILGRSVLG
jgi:hypothetical protein